VTQGINSPNSHSGLKNNQQTAVTSDAQIAAETTPMDSEIINELLSRVTQGFDTPNAA